MFSTKPTNSLKKLFAGYHQPLPLSKRQTQEIVTGLKTSFRNQLDREYGRSSQDAAQDASGDAANKSAPPFRQSAAQHHLKTILSNPLFSHTTKELSSFAPETFKTSRSELQVPRQGPMEVFDHAVSKGLMTIQAAAGCMHAVRKQMASSSEKGDVALFEVQEVASKVVGWLISSGQERSLEFLDKTSFMQGLLTFLRIEGMERIAWGWLQRVMTDESLTLTMDERVAKASNLLQRMIQVHLSPLFTDPNAAISTILDAELLLRGNPRMPQILLLPWRSVSWYATVEASRQMPATEAAFARHVATADLIDKPLLVEKAHLSLWHPSSPSPTPALDLFLHDDIVRRFTNNIKPSKAKPLGQINWLEYLAHDTLKHLDATGRSEEARAVRHALRDMFPKMGANAAFSSPAS